MFLISEVAQAAEGMVVAGKADRLITGIGADSRTLQPGDLFVALSGPRFDGHDYLQQAAARGAAGVVVKQGESLRPGFDLGETSVIEVADPLTALGDLAKTWRHRHLIPAVAVTGSVGKTTTKNMLLSVLRKLGAVCGTEGNKNNLIGVPQTVFRLRPEHRWLVTELGTDRPGEIARLTEIVSPTVGVITAVEPCHLGRLASLRSVAVEKAQLFAGMKDDGSTWMRSGLPYARELARVSKSRIRTYGMNRSSDCRAENILLDEEGRASFDVVEEGLRTPMTLRVIGRHQVYNALGAYAAARSLGIEPTAVAEGLRECEPEWGRLGTRPTARGACLLEDVYNASPASFQAALEVLGQRRAARKYVVAGDMLDLGPYAEEAHRELGRILAGARLDGVYVLGDWSGAVVEAARACGLNGSIRRAESHEEIAEDLQQRLQEGDLVLLKGSRAMQMERISHALAV